MALCTWAYYIPPPPPDSDPHLSDLLPNRVNESYDLRNHQNFQVPFSRLCSFDSSFFPSTLRHWNGLDISVQNSHPDPHLSDLLPNRVNESYDLRNHQNFQVPFSRLCSFDSSFFPSTLRHWNGLGISVQNSPTLLEFKTKLRNQAQKDKASGILSIGERKLIIILTRIRHYCSNLNVDLHRVNIVGLPTPSCSCSAAQHYFFECRNFVNQRQNPFRASSFISVITLDTLLYGCSTFDNERFGLIAVLRPFDTF